MCPRFLVADHLGWTTPPCSGPSCPPSTPSPSLLVGWMLPFHQAWLGCGFLPCQSSGLQPARLAAVDMLAAATNVLSLAGWKAANTVLLPMHESSYFPPDGEPWPTMLAGCTTMVGSTALYPPGGPIGKKMGVMTKLFRLHLLNHQVPLQMQQGSPE